MSKINTAYRATARAATAALMVVFSVSAAIAEEPEACCFPDDSECQYLPPQECSDQGGNSLGPETDCSAGFCCPSACCLPDRTCDTLTFYDCTAVNGGIWRGTALSCDLVDCEPPQACCADVVGCTDVPPQTCQNDMGGVPQGLGTTCDLDPCPPLPPRACCEPDGDCWDMRSAADLLTCVQQEGMPMNVSCLMTFCLQTEACCIDVDGDSECVNMPSFACSLSGGIAQGVNTTCSTTVACGSGVCCLEGGACELNSPWGCTSQGGSFISGQDFCGATTCDAQACCFGADPCAGAYCDVAPIGFCVESGGQPLGPDENCAEWPCGTGACCMPDGSCEERSAVECLEIGGELQGSGTRCNSVSCEPFRAGACCLGPTECVITREAATCTDLGGNFLGFGTGCPTQTVEYYSEPGGEVCSHAIVTVVDCPQSGLARSAPCVESPGALLDAWTSPEDATVCHNFGVSGSPPIPADFFGPGSDPFYGPVCLRGVPLGVVTLPEFGVLDVGQSDTLIRREGDPFDRCDLPSPNPETVSIRMAALSLESVAPILVSHNSGQSLDYWSVTVDLSDVYSDGDPTNDPPTGTLAAVMSHCNGGTYTSVLYVQPRFTFTMETDPAEMRVLDLGLAGIAPILLDASVLPAAWVSDVHLSLEAMSPFCTDFHPGIGQDTPSVECDCNINNVRDRCDIESGVSLDCNLNEVPDSCDLDDGTSGDCNTNTIPDECDIASAISLDCNFTGVPDECESIEGFDFDGNGIIDLADYRAFAEVMVGPGLVPSSPPPSCLPSYLNAFDGNGDSDVDLADFSHFQTVISAQRRAQRGQVDLADYDR